MRLGTGAYSLTACRHQGPPAFRPGYGWQGDAGRELSRSRLHANSSFAVPPLWFWRQRLRPERSCQAPEGSVFDTALGDGVLTGQEILGQDQQRDTYQCQRVASATLRLSSRVRETSRCCGQRSRISSPEKPDFHRREPLSAAISLQPAMLTSCGSGRPGYDLSESSRSIPANHTGSHSSWRWN